MDEITPFNRDYAEELYVFLKNNPKNECFRIGIPKVCSLLTFLNFYTQEIVNSEFSNSELTNFEKVLLFPISENHKVFGLYTATLYFPKFKESEAYIEMLFDNEHKDLDLITNSLKEIIKYLINNYKLNDGILFFMILKKDEISQQAIINNGGVIYNTSKYKLYMKIALTNKN